MKKLYKGLTIIIVLLILCLTGCTRKYNDIVIKDKKDLIELEDDYLFWTSRDKSLNISIKYEGVSKINVYGKTTFIILFIDIEHGNVEENELIVVETNCFAVRFVAYDLPIQYIDIIFSDELGILGYGVIRVEGPTKPYDDAVHLIIETSAIFPEVKGKRQNVTIGQVKEIIEKERKVPLSNEKDA